MNNPKRERRWRKAEHRGVYLEKTKTGWRMVITENDVTHRVKLPPDVLTRDDAYRFRASRSRRGLLEYVESYEATRVHSRISRGGRPTGGRGVVLFGKWLSIKDFAGIVGATEAAVYWRIRNSTGATLGGPAESLLAKPFRPWPSRQMNNPGVETEKPTG